MVRRQNIDKGKVKYEEFRLTSPLSTLDSPSCKDTVLLVGTGGKNFTHINEIIFFPLVLITLVGDCFKKKKTTNNNKKKQANMTCETFQHEST